jgi:hypothetical protein
MYTTQKSVMLVLFEEKVRVLFLFLLLLLEVELLLPLPSLLSLAGRVTGKP